MTRQQTAGAAARAAAPKPDASLFGAADSRSVPEIPLVEWGSLALRAGRIGPILPHMAWVVRFDEILPRDVLVAESVRLAATPYGVGRRIVRNRFPGGRLRWRPSPEVPLIDFADTPAVGADGVSKWMNSRLGVRLDPEFDAGWKMFVTYTEEGGTVVLVIVHHLFGTARGVVGAMYAGAGEDPTDGTTGLRFEPANNYTRRAELRGIRERFALGALGIAKLAAAAPEQLRERRARDGRVDPSLPKPIKAPRGYDKSRKPLAERRVTAMAYMTADEWDSTAARWGGTGNTLLAAVSANLLRRARLARGGSSSRPMQLLLPMDLSDRDDLDSLGLRATDPAADATMTTANVVVPGGAPVYGDLTELRARMKAAFIADAGGAPVVRGAGDAMRLVPEALTFKLAARAAQKFDGCVSNVGFLPPAMQKIGDYDAANIVMLGYPIGNESLTALFRYDDRLAISTLTDPARMGGDDDLRTWLTEELGAWGLTDVVA